MSVDRILIVDDDPNHLAATRRILRRSGYAVDTALNGRQGLRAALNNPPDLVLADISMPHMSGQEFLRRFRRLERHGRIHRDDKIGTPVIFVSALSAHSQRVGGLDAGGADYITKPFDADELRARVRRHLQETRHNRQLLVGARLETLRHDSFMDSLRLQIEECRRSLYELEDGLASAESARRSRPREELLSQTLQSVQRLADALAERIDRNLPEAAQDGPTNKQ